MDIPVFGTKKLVRALFKLGFVIDEKRGKGSHIIATHTIRKQLDTRLRPFITIPQRKEFYPPSRNSLVKEIMTFGFSKEEVLETLFGKK